MRSALIALRVTGVAVALTALTAVSAPTVLAAGEENRGGVSVDPHQAEPGAQVKLRVRGCEDKWASAKSAVFVSEVHLSSGRDGDRTLTGDAMVSSTAQPGWHDIRVKCDGGEDRVRGSIEVVRRRDDHEKGHDKEREKERDRPDPHRSPVWPVHAGGGGMSAELAAQDQAAAAKKNHGGDGPGLPHTVIGAVLAAAATLAVAFRALTLRRRRSGE
ncbi:MULTISPECIES: hypothetical protein [unclassified Streptomyces]|uniref:MYXO-CTERM domain-containing protein n=1 Tax=Streptomyces sp. R33 TaxID=3238629 RepID=A0AB39Y7F1_9ACTN|nr:MULTISPECIES: hypothetical protein [unclassified Streptomyces]KJY44883.1 hypothetical protein VR46_17885 [Streptomyces sp. NRRL S-444]KOY50151.1 hypothetical protein ADK59_38565 [Streptomyces sp. XY332]